MQIFLLISRALHKFFSLRKDLLRNWIFRLKYPNSFFKPLGQNYGNLMPIEKGGEARVVHLGGSSVGRKSDNTWEARTSHLSLIWKMGRWGWDMVVVFHTLEQNWNSRTKTGKRKGIIMQVAYTQLPEKNFHIQLTFLIGKRFRDCFFAYKSKVNVGH